MSELLFQPRSDTAARLLGLGFSRLARRCFTGRASCPYSAAIRDKPLVEYSIKLVILGEFFAVTGSSG